MIRPQLHAYLNGSVAILLVLAFIAIKYQYKRIHATCMGLAILFSTIFLISYIQYHMTTHIITRYTRMDWTRIAYFGMLISHTILAVAILPAIVLAVWYAIRGQFSNHTAITRWLFPIWLYVAITGVAIYIVLY